VPPREWRLRLTDILESIARIQQYTRGMSLEAFAQDTKTMDAVIRNITIIGEAARHVPDDIMQRHPQVPWADMRDTRNILVHVYFGVKTDVLWETIQNDLPPLVPLLRELLEGGG
jgi:hypothetical protein